MLRIVLVRHGSVPGIEPERFRGGSTFQLTERGIEEARRTARRIAQHWRPAMVYTSPRQRCIDTGRFIAERCAAPTRVLDDLFDLDYGEWTDRTHEEIRAAQPVQYRLWKTQPHLMRFPGGISLQDVAMRVADALRYVVATHPDGTIVMVGHDSGNRSLLLHLMGLPLSAYWRLQQSPCNISEITIGDDGATLIRMNETAHLEAGDAPLE
jgi:probable phosphoglycerate mutase